MNTHLHYLKFETSRCTAGVRCMYNQASLQLLQCSKNLDGIANPTFDEEQFPYRGLHKKSNDPRKREREEELEKMNMKRVKTHLSRLRCYWAEKINNMSISVQRLSSIKSNMELARPQKSHIGNLYPEAETPNTFCVSRFSVPPKRKSAQRV